MFPVKDNSQICNLLWDPSAGINVDTSWSQMLCLFPRGQRSDCLVLPVLVRWWTPRGVQSEFAAERKSWRNFGEAHCGEGTFISRGWRSSLSQFSFLRGVLLIHFPCPQAADLWIQTGDLLGANRLLYLLYQWSCHSFLCLPKTKLCLRGLFCLHLEVCHMPARHIKVTKKKKKDWHNRWNRIEDGGWLNSSWGEKNTTEQKYNIICYLVKKYWLPMLGLQMRETLQPGLNYTTGRRDNRHHLKLLM